jgi:nitrogen regulatory protein PII
MKLIVAVIPPHTLDAVQQALAPLGARLISVSQVIGGCDPGYTEIYRGRTVRVRRPRLRLEVAAEWDAVESAVQAIQRSAELTGAEQSDAAGIYVVELTDCAHSLGGNKGLVATRAG